MVITVIRAPEWVCTQAVMTLSRYRKHRVFACRIHRTGHLSLRVNRRWRLLSRDNGRNWQLMSHEAYNGKKDRK
nr:hypothetical protein [Dickeya sp. ws52]